MSIDRLIDTDSPNQFTTLVSPGEKLNKNFGRQMREEADGKGLN